MSVLETANFFQAPRQVLLFSGGQQTFSILDKFFCSHSFEYRVTVFKSCLKTKHKAVVATGYQATYTCNNQPSGRKKIVVFDLRDSNTEPCVIA